MPSFARRVDRAVRGYAPPRVRRWCAQAARQLEHQFHSYGAQPHAALALPMAKTLRLAPAQTAAAVQVYDLLQTAIDLADNIADAREDEAAGRAPAYVGIPPAALVCLPSLLVGMALATLSRAFSETQFRTSYSARRVLEILGDMVVGQAVPKRQVRHDRLVSGRQGLLLCLPFWLASRRHVAWRRRLPALERWAYAFGLTWEAHQCHVDAGTERSAAAYRNAVETARAAWPSFPPFVAGHPLSAGNLLVAGVC